MKARSPIEMMVDRACGVDPANDTLRIHKPMRKKDIDPAAQALLAVADASVKWWRKVSKSMRANAIDHELMRAVEAWMKVSGEK